VFTAIQDAFGRLFETQPAPPELVVLITAVIALAAAIPRPVWRFTRGFITIAHEGGHALAAVLSGRQLAGIKLHSDSSGLTLSRGRPSGPGMVITGLAGYTTPPVMGLIGAALLGYGKITLLLWVSLAVLPIMLVMIRNVYGAVSIITTMAIIFGVIWYGDPETEGAFAYVFVWFLLIGGVRPVLELQRSRSRGQAPSSDADQVGRLTGLPGFAWVIFFALVSLGALALGTRWLVEPLL
jgi:hypothetical protein